eukprot:10045074-Lingulodinium_polyedra.AAC.1
MLTFIALPGNPDMDGLVLTESPQASREMLKEHKAFRLPMAATWRDSVMGNPCAINASALNNQR